MTQSESESWLSELGRAERVYSPHAPPRAPDDDQIRAYLRRELDPLDEAEVESLIVMYREWAEAEARIIQADFESKQAPLTPEDGTSEEAGWPEWMPEEVQHQFGTYWDQDADDVLGELCVAAGEPATRSGEHPLAPYLDALRELLSNELGWESNRESLLKKDDRELSLAVADVLRRTPDVTPFGPLLAVWLVKFGLDQILDSEG